MFEFILYYTAEIFHFPKSDKFFPISIESIATRYEKVAFLGLKGRANSTKTVSPTSVAFCKSPNSYIIGIRRSY